MISNEVRVKMLKEKVKVAEEKGNGASGVVRKWKRQIRNLTA